MRPILLGVLAGSAATISAKSTCVRDNFDELVSRTSCGDDDAISRCLTHANLQKLDEIELCFYAGGCEIKDAVVGAQWFSEDCHAHEEVEKPELRKRATSESAEATTAASTAAATTTIASTSATTTADSSSSTTASTTTSASTASSTLSSSTTTSSSSSSASTSSSSSTTGLVCSTTSSFSTSVCSYSSGTTIGCTSTMTGTLTCAAGIICSTDSAGAGICMKRQDSLTTSGVVIAIAFSVGIASFLIALMVMYFQSNSKMKKDQAERMALLTNQTYGKESDPEATPAPGQSYAQRRAAHRGVQDADVDLPLIGADRQQGGNQAYSSQTRTTNSSRDQSPSNSPVVHPDHPALN